MNAEVRYQAIRDAAERLGGDSPAWLRHDWRLAEVEALFDLPFMDLHVPGAAGAPRSTTPPTACR